MSQDYINKLHWDLNNGAYVTAVTTSKSILATNKPLDPELKRLASKSLDLLKIYEQYSDIIIGERQLQEHLLLALHSGKYITAAHVATLIINTKHLDPKITALGQRTLVLLKQKKLVPDDFMDDEQARTKTATRILDKNRKF
jgi:hypothetical protein